MILNDITTSGPRIVSTFSVVTIFPRNMNISTTQKTTAHVVTIFAPGPPPGANNNAVLHGQQQQQQPHTHLWLLSQGRRSQGTVRLRESYYKNKSDILFTTKT